MLNLSSLTLALAAPALMAGSPIAAQDAKSVAESATEFAAELIMAGEQRAALTRLEEKREADPKDPAILINLGIAYAQLGYDQKAKAQFEDALTSPIEQDLTIADGRTIDSRRLARKALQMLDRGEFRPT